MAAGPVESKRRTPVVHHEDDPPHGGQTEADEEGVEVTPMLVERVTVRARVTQLVGVAHADEIGSHAPPEALQMGDDVAPEVTRRRVAVEEQDRPPAGMAAGGGVDVGHVPFEDRGELLLHGGPSLLHWCPVPYSTISARARSRTGGPLINSVVTTPSSQ